MRLVLIGSLALAAYAVSPPFAAPSVAQTAAAPRSSVTTSDFRRLALMAEVFDFESSRLAIQRSRRPSVKRYASALTGNFRGYYTRLTSGAGVFADFPALPADPNAPIKPFVDERRVAMLNQLGAATGRGFDRLYMDMHLGVRQEVLGLYETYLRSGDDPALRAFARERLPVLEQQSQAARRLAGR